MKSRVSNVSIYHTVSNKDGGSKRKHGEAYRNTYIFCSDIQAALKAICTTKITLPTILKCVEVLENHAKTKRKALMGILEHCSIGGAALKKLIAGYCSERTNWLISNNGKAINRFFFLGY